MRQFYSFWLPNEVYKKSGNWIITGLGYGNPSLKLSGICSVLLLGCLWQTQSGSALIFFFRVGKVMPVTPLLGGVFMHRAFCAYCLRIEKVVGNA